MEDRAAPPRFPSVVHFFRRHPVLLLFAFTPGIPEYLSGSTPVYPLVVAPPIFFIFLALNLGLYGPGVLLVREAWVRWGRSWGSLLCLGAAYAFLEEGTALSTMFNPNAGPVGALGHYGRFAGANWVWIPGVLCVHIVLSVGLPILLLGLALPETRGRSLVSRRELVGAAFVYALAILALMGITGYVRVEPGWVLGAAVIALALWVVAWRLPRGALDPPSERPARGPRAFLLLGPPFLPILLLEPFLGLGLGLPPVGTVAIELAMLGGLFFAIRSAIGRAENSAQYVLLAFGTTLAVVGAGILSQLLLPVVLVLDGVYALFFLELWRRYRPRPGPPGAATTPAALRG